MNVGVLLCVVEVASLLDFFGMASWKSHLTGLDLSNPRVLWQGNTFNTSICPCSDHEFEIFFSGHHESS